MTIIVSFFIHSLFQLYRDDHFFFMKPVHPENTTDMPLVTDKCYHIILYNPHPLIIILMLTLFVVIYKEENNILMKLIQH
jgi:hypothetical protein